MSKKPTDSELKTALGKIKDRRYLAIARLNFLQRSHNIQKRRALRKRLEPIFRKTGLAIDEIDKLLLQNQNESRRFLKEQNNKAKVAFAEVEKVFRQGFETNRNAPPNLLPNVIELKPFLIWRNLIPGSNQFKFESHIGSGSGQDYENNWAKIAFNDDVDTTGNTGNVVFYFRWQNPDPNSFAVVNVNTNLVVKGICQAGANPGFFSGGSSDLNLSGHLTLWQWWDQPPSEPFLQSSQDVSNILDVGASGGEWEWGSLGALNSKYVFNAFDLSYQNFIIPNLAEAIFEVSLSFWYSISDGSVTLDFDGNGLDYYIKCPFLELTLLTAIQKI